MQDFLAESPERLSGPQSPLDGRFTDLFDAVLNDAGVGVALGGVEMPRMNVGTDLPA
ncbi:hypothetical protein [Streptomyces sp. NPDC055681]